MSTPTARETIAEAKERVGDLVVYTPTGEYTNVQGWEYDEEHGALAIAVLVNHGLRLIPSTKLIEMPYPSF